MAVRPARTTAWVLFGKSHRLIHQEGRPLRTGLVERSVYFERDYLFLAISKATVAASLKSVLVPVAFATASTLVTS